MKTLYSTQPNTGNTNLKNTAYWLVIISTAFFILKITQDIPVITSVSNIQP